MLKHLKKEIKNMNNNMARHIYLPTIESKKQNKQKSSTEIESYRERSDGCQMGELRGWVKKMKGLRGTNW